jgi:hypothetical protein
MTHIFPQIPASRQVWAMRITCLFRRAVAAATTLSLLARPCLQRVGLCDIPVLVSALLTQVSNILFFLYLDLDLHAVFYLSPNFVLINQLRKL